MKLHTLQEIDPLRMKLVRAEEKPEIPFSEADYSGDITHGELLDSFENALSPAPTPQEQASDADDWIEWKGGECPVPRGTLVNLNSSSASAGESSGLR